MCSKRKYDYGSEFSCSESEFEIDGKKNNDKELYESSRPAKLGLFQNYRSTNTGTKIPSKRTFSAELDKQEGRRMKYHGILAMDAFARHQKLVNDYLIYYGGKREDFKTDHKHVTEKEIIKQNNKFLWDEDESMLSWEKQLALKYWKKLFKEYSIADLTRFKENKIALRWRIEKEVLNGKGQFTCGNKHCSEKEGLRSWEVNFAYVEEGDKKNALVKLRLCPECSYKLNYRHKRKEAKKRSKRKEGELSSGETHKTTDDYQAKRECTSSKRGNEDRGKEEEESAWSRPPATLEEMSREDEFDKYFEDMFP